jgi:hypothetical protein
VYDGAGRGHYRNAVVPVYENHRFVWHLAGTNALQEIDESELGARFLDCILMDEIDDEFEDDVIMRAAMQESDAMIVESNGNIESSYPPNLAKAMQLSGGYLFHLISNAPELVAKVEFPVHQLRFCTRLAKFIAFMRARPPKRENAESSRELAARLSKQVTRLARVLAVVLNRPSVDDSVMKRVHRVTMDTSRGKTLEMAHYMMGRGREEGTVPKAMATAIGVSDFNCRKFLMFLRTIKATETFATKNAQGVQSSVKWRLTTTVENLYREVMRYEVD